MSDVTFTDKNDVFDQSRLPPKKSWDWGGYIMLAGDDIARIFEGYVVGGSGHDIIERLIDPDQPSYQVGISYWDSPSGVNVDLPAGKVQDGWGTTDTLIGTIDIVFGSPFDDTMLGDAGNNRFATGGGHDHVDGGKGTDVVDLPWNKGDPPDLRNFNVAVSLDGLSATITSGEFPGLVYDLRNVEKLTRLNSEGTDWIYFNLADFIRPMDMARQGLTGADNQRWNSTSAHGTPVIVSYSFMRSEPGGSAGVEGFRAFNDSEMAVVRSILSSTSVITGISFAEVAESGGNSGQIRFGVSQQAVTKGTSFMPEVSPASAGTGKVWMDADSMLDLSVGSEGYEALIHEIGHALGLRHPRNIDPGDAWTQQWRPEDDMTANTVMSGTASPDGLFRADWGPMDVAALRYMYGTRAVNTGDTVYRVGGMDAQAQRTIVDDGGIDTIDASDSPVGVALDMTNGHSSSVGLTASGRSAMGNLEIAVATQVENAVGSNHDDVILGNASDNRLDGRLGNDWIDGGLGVDTAVFAGPRSAYSVSTEDGRLIVAANDGVSGFSTLVSIERLKFSDQSLALDLDGNAGLVARLLGAVFGASAVGNRQYVGIGLSLADGGMSAIDLAALALAATGRKTPGSIVDLLWGNVVGYAPSPAQAKPYVDLLNTHSMSVGQLVVLAAKSVPNEVNIDLVGLAEVGLAFLDAG